MTNEWIVLGDASVNGNADHFTDVPVQVLGEVSISEIAQRDEKVPIRGDDYA